MTLAPPVAPLSPGLTEQQRERYRRQLQLPNFGEAAQQRLLESSVLVTGVGGLGGCVSPVPYTLPTPTTKDEE